MNYQEFLDYIYQRHSGNVKLGLDRMFSILKEMGEPNLKLKGIHIGGTNGKGSTVGSYTLYRMKKSGIAPAGIINKECETVVAVGTIISEIPCVDEIDISKIKTGDMVRLENGVATIRK